MTRFVSVLSPLGPLLLAGEECPAHLRFPGSEPDPAWQNDSDAFPEAKSQLAAYFSGATTQFDLPLAPEGTEFQHRVWAALRQIPHGETATYKDIATAIGQPGAMRAVGRANGANPIPILIPCHRVVAADGIGGFSGPPDIKRRLLEFEGAERQLRLI